MVKKPIPVVVGIIKRQQTILIAERPPHKPYAGYWEFPGGKIEADETPIKALGRELQEELGIEVMAALPWFSYAHPYPDKTVALQLWVVEAFKGEPQSKEGQALRWVTVDELATFALLEGNQQILDRIETLFSP